MEDLEEKVEAGYRDQNELLRRLEDEAAEVRQRLATSCAQVFLSCMPRAQPSMEMEYLRYNSQAEVGPSEVHSWCMYAHVSILLSD